MEELIKKYLFLAILTVLFQIYPYEPEDITFLEVNKINTHENRQFIALLKIIEDFQIANDLIDERFAEPLRTLLKIKYLLSEDVAINKIIAPYLMSPKRQFQEAIQKSSGEKCLLRCNRPICENPFHAKIKFKNGEEFMDILSREFSNCNAVADLWGATFDPKKTFNMNVRNSKNPKCRLKCNNPTCTNREHPGVTFSKGEIFHDITSDLYPDCRYVAKIWGAVVA